MCMYRGHVCVTMCMLRTKVKFQASFLNFHLVEEGSLLFLSLMLHLSCIWYMWIKVKLLVPLCLLPIRIIIKLSK